MRVTLSANSAVTTNRWLQDYADRKVLLPGGITLDAAQWVANGDGQKIVPSGTVVGRTDLEAKFGPADAADAEVYICWGDHNITLDGELTEVCRAGLLIEKFMPTLGVGIKALLRDRGFQFLAYAEGVDE